VADGPPPGDRLAAADPVKIEARPPEESHTVPDTATRSDRLWRAYLAALVLAILAFFFVPTTSMAHSAWQVGLGWSAATFVVVGMRRIRPEGATTWYLFAIGVFLNTTGILVAEILTRVYHITGDPTLADAFYLGIFPCTGVGLELLIRRRKAERSWSSVVDTTIVTTGMALLSWVFLIEPNVGDLQRSLSARVVVCAYPIGDLAILAMMIRLALSGGARNTSLRLTFGALFFFLGTDVGWAVVAQLGVSPTRIVRWALESGSLMAFTLIGAAALHPSVAELARPSPARPEGLGRVLLAGLTAASLIAPGVLALQALHRRVTDGVAIALCSTVLFVLVVVRMALLLKRLEEQSRQLAADISARKEVERRLVDSLDHLHRAQQQLLRASRMAGMAEIATSVLHNVGNVLNSVNVASGSALEILGGWPSESFAKVVGILRTHELDRDFLATNPKGKQVLAYLEQLVKVDEGDRARMRQQLEALQRNIDHIKMIVTSQQAQARSPDALTELLDPVEVIEDALRVIGSWGGADGIELVRHFQTVAPVEIERHKLQQIVTNLLANAQQALAAATKRTVTVHIGARENDRFVVEVEDTGCGILPENLTRIFNHGFTTRKDGHGFGLHSSALAASQMGGGLVGLSEGPGRGARFVLDLPTRPAHRVGVPR
jgi:signal transduction histidine kinase